MGCAGKALHLNLLGAKPVPADFKHSASPMQGLVVLSGDGLRLEVGQRIPPAEPRHHVGRIGGQEGLVIEEPLGRFKHQLNAEARSPK